MSLESTHRRLWWNYLSEAIFVPVTLAGLVLVLMLPVLRPPTGNEVLNGHDLVNQQYPLYSFIFDSVRNGNGLPLWNPYQFGGQSIPGNPQSTIFYAPAWIMALTDVPHGVGWLVILHLWLGGWGMAAFVGQLGASRVGALVGGIVYTFSGVIAAHLNAGHLNYLMCAAWLPWMAAGYLWSIGRTNWFIRALAGGAAVGMCILAGHPPMLYFGLLWLAVMFLYVVFGTKQTTFFQAFRPLVVMLAVGGLLGAVLLLPVAEFTTRSTRVDGGLGFSNSYAMPPEQLVTLVIPNLFGEPNRGYWGVPFYEELTAYMGILPLVALFLDPAAGGGGAADRICGGWRDRQSGHKRRIIHGSALSAAGVQPFPRAITGAVFCGGGWRGISGAAGDGFADGRPR